MTFFAVREPDEAPAILSDSVPATFIVRSIATFLRRARPPNEDYRSLASRARGMPRARNAGR